MTEFCGVERKTMAVLIIGLVVAIPVAGALVVCIIEKLDKWMED